MGFSYGFREKRSQHNALDALYVGISRCKINYILDADISGLAETDVRSELEQLATL